MAICVYSIEDDFPNKWVCPETLENEIRASDIESVYLYCVISGDDCILHFSVALSIDDEAMLDAIVAAHTGQPPALAPQQVSLVGGDSDAGVARVAVQGAAIPLAATEFVLGASGELDADQPIETVSDVIPSGKMLHVLFARASCRPLVDGTSGTKNCLLVELLWRETIDEEDIDHLFGKSYLELVCSEDFPASSVCFDGTPMTGDGETTKFVIRRTVFGDVDAQDTLVAVRGYYE